MMPVNQSKASAYSSAYQPLLEAGYSPIPIMPGEKAPGEVMSGRWVLMANWPQYKNKAPDQLLARRWAGFDGAGIGVILGTPAGEGYELAAIDFDTDQQALLETMEASVPPSPVRKRGARGYTAFYRVPAGTKGRRYRRDKSVICELLTGTNTRQTVIPPTVHPGTGQPYVWISPKTLADVQPFALPVLTADDLERFDDTLCALSEVERVTARVAAPTAGDPDANVWRQLNDAALQNLDAWVPKLGLHKLSRSPSGYKAIPHWRPSSTGRHMRDRSPNLGISRDGIRDFGTDQTFTPLDLLMAACSWDLDHAFGWLCRQLGIEEHDVPLIEVNTAKRERGRECANAMGDGGHDVADGPEEAQDWDDESPVPQEFIDEGPAPEPPEADDEHVPRHLLDVPGILGEMVQWILATSRRPNAPLALGAAISAAGTIIGRKVATPTRSGTHIYVLGVAPTGAGKDRPLRAACALLEAASLHGAVGPDEVMSQTALIRLVKRQPRVLMPMDEIGAFLRRIGDRRASGHERGITKILRMFWGASFEKITTPEYASSQSEVLEAPALSIYGTSTPDEFFSGLSSADVANGFLNRFLILMGDPTAHDKDPDTDARSMPPALISGLGSVYRAVHLAQGEPGNRPITPGVTTFDTTWADGAQAAWSAFSHSCQDQAGAGAPMTRDCFARTGEIAVRLATIRAIFDRRTEVSIEDVEWGAGLAWYSAARMAQALEEHLVETRQQGDHKIVADIIRAKRRLTMSDLTRDVRGRVRARDLKDIVESLVEAGIITKSVAIAPRGGNIHTLIWRG